MEKRKKKEKRETENAIVVSSPRAMNEEGFMGVNRRGGMNTERERENERKANDEAFVGEARTKEG